MKSNPLVSVVIPTIKFDEFTEISLKSVLNQSYNNWEIVLVLDGARLSTVPQWVIEHDKIITVVHQTRLGTPISLNDGARASNGDLIARLDADDIAHPERLKLQVEFLQDNPSVVCVGASTLIVDEGGNLVSELVKTATEGDVRRLLLVKNQLVHSSVMYRKGSFEYIGGYNPIMKRSQDYDLYLRLGKLGPIALLGETLCAYRVHIGQHSRKTSPFARYTLEILLQRNELRRFLHESPVKQSCRDIVWYFAQIVRHLGLRKPNYLKVEVENELNQNGRDWLSPPNVLR